MRRFFVITFIILNTIKLFKCTENNNTLFRIRTTKTGPNPPWNETRLDQLRKNLLTNYNAHVDYGSYHDTSSIDFDITITHLDTDELNSTLTVTGWLKLKWTDHKLKWNKDDYGGIESIKMADHEIWHPDLYLSNRDYKGDTIARYGNPYAVISSNGEVIWVPPTKFSAFCEFDLYYWPFDSQHCSLKWYLADTSVSFSIEARLPEPILHYFPSSNPWEVDASYLGNRTVVHINLDLTRKSTSYIAVVIIPILATISLILIQCSIPGNSGQKIVLSSCSALMVAILLSFFLEKVSHTGNHTPWIISFYSTCLCMVGISMAESIFVLLKLKDEQKQPLPWIMKKHLQGKLGKWLLLGNYVEEYHTTIQRHTAEEMKEYHLSEPDNDKMIKSTSKHLLQQEWEILTVGLDRLLFVVYSFIFFVLILCYVI